MGNDEIVYQTKNFHKDYRNLQSLLKSKYDGFAEVVGAFKSDRNVSCDGIGIKANTPYIFISGERSALTSLSKDLGHRSVSVLNDSLYRYTEVAYNKAQEAGTLVKQDDISFIPANENYELEIDFDGNPISSSNQDQPPTQSPIKTDEQKQLSKARQALVDRVLSRLDAGEMPWDNGMQGITAPRNAISGAAYRGINLLNLFLAGKSDPRWLTFNQAKDNGYAVKKGAKGVPIELYKTIDKRTGKDADFTAIKKEVKDMTFDERQAFKRENLQTFSRSYYVFNASDVLGIEPYKPKPVDISARNERIEAVIAASEAPIYYDGNGRNYYSIIPDKIHLTERSAFTSNEFFYNKCVHEMAHSTGHSSRLNRVMLGIKGSPEYAREELVAEISSVLTAAELGLNYSDRVMDNSAEYVRSWAQLIRNNPQTLIDAAFDASHATDYICGIGQYASKFEERTQKRKAEFMHAWSATSAIERAAIKDELLQMERMDFINDNTRGRERLSWVREWEAAQEKAQKESVQSNVSPLYKDYTAMQEKYPDAVVVWRLGDFYEVMGEKARTVADEVGLTLTSRDVGLPERVPMFGFPHHATEQYIEKIRRNHAVAIVEGEGQEVFMSALKTPLEKSAQKESLQSNVKEWYSRTYPTDELASSLNAEATFGTVRDTLRSGKDIYTVLGSSDSVVRERVFRELAGVLDVPYRAVYNSWIESTESAEARKERYERVMRQDYPQDFISDELHDAAESFANHTPTYDGQEQKTQKEMTDSEYRVISTIAGNTSANQKSVNVEWVALASTESKETVLQIAEKYGCNITDGEMSIPAEMRQAYHVEWERRRATEAERERYEYKALKIALKSIAAGEGVSEYITFEGTDYLIHVNDLLQKYGAKRDDNGYVLTPEFYERFNELQSKWEEKTQKESKVEAAHEFKTNLDNIPNAMKALPNWVAFRTKTLDDGKVKKILLSPNKGASSVEYLKWAKANDPTTWSTFDKAVVFAKKYKLDGLAFAMGGSGITCIDLDHCLDENGKPSALAQKFIAAANGTYMEKSVSGRGLHIFYAGSRPEGRQNRNIELDIEAYDSTRFMSMTGNLYGDVRQTVNAPSAELKSLLESNLAKLTQYSAPSAPLGMDDNALIDKIRSSKRCSEFDALMSGRILSFKANGEPDHSASDFHLCNILAFFSGGDVTQVERVFKTSGLYRPKKGDAYVRRTAESACSRLKKTYTPKSNRKPGGKPIANGSGGACR